MSKFTPTMLNPFEEHINFSQDVGTNLHALYSKAAEINN